MTCWRARQCYFTVSTKVSGEWAAMDAVEDGSGKVDKRDQKGTVDKNVMHELVVPITIDESLRTHHQHHHPPTLAAPWWAPRRRAPPPALPSSQHPWPGIGPRHWRSSEVRRRRGEPAVRSYHGPDRTQPLGKTAERAHWEKRLGGRSELVWEGWAIVLEAINHAQAHRPTTSTLVR